MSSAKVAKSLSEVLADTYVLQTKTQNYHWNVVGPQFHSLHVMFEQQYTELFAAVDEIAERIRQIGHPAPGTMAEFLVLTSLSEADASSAPGMIADLAACHSKVMARLHSCLKLATEAEDDSTQDLMIKRLNAHDKVEWMLRATLGDEPVAMTVNPKVASAAAVKATKVKKKVKSKPVKPVSKPQAKIPAAPTKTMAKAPAKPVSAPPKKVEKKKGRVALG